MTDDQIAQLAKLSEGMSHVLEALKGLKENMAEIRREFVSRTHYEGEIAALKLRLQSLEEAAKKSPFDAITRFFAAVSVVGGGIAMLVLAAQWLARHP